ncbi:MAG: Cell division protein DedD (protein involved in septation), partial [Verrucomicrobia bacterium]
PSVAGPLPVTPKPAPPKPVAPLPPTAGQIGWTLSFAALLNEQRAITMATSIRVDGKPVRVVPGTRDGTTIFRIVAGPFDTHDDAEKAGKRTGLPYWVYAGAP